jgi:hypothetical protein
MIGTFTTLRMVAMLKRIAVALEESNELNRLRMEREGLVGRKSKKVEISHPTVDSWNENHERKRGRLTGFME